MKTKITYIRLENKIHETKLTLQVRQPPDELGRYQLSKGQLQKARRTLCPDSTCSLAGCGRDGAGQRGYFLHWLVSANGLVEKNTYPGDDRLELSVSVPCERYPGYQSVYAMCFAGPIMRDILGPAEGYAVWQQGKLIARFKKPRSSVVGLLADPQKQALQHAARFLNEQLSRKLEEMLVQPLQHVAGDQRCWW